MQVVLVEDWRLGGFGIYIHWPFCQSKCPYCDFNSHVSNEINQDRWLNAYLNELRRVAAHTSDRVVSTVYFGGGTPSLMDPKLVGRILESVRALWPCANKFEVTLEANPGSVETGRFKGFQDSGINRVSLGVQALNNGDLKRLGRTHSAEDALTALEVSRKIFDRTSFDLIYARQDQTLNDWRLELENALSLSPSHLSLYQLTVEAGTAFGDRYARGGLKGLPDDELAADMYELTQEKCASVGLIPYEISNYAMLDSESKHNLIYWRGGDYVGIGPGAHGRLTICGARYATESWRNPTKWLNSVDAGNGESLRQPINSSDQGAEYLLMGLRLSEGINLGRYKAISGQTLNLDRVNELIELGLIASDGRSLKVLPRGRLILNSVLRELTVD